MKDYISMQKTYMVPTYINRGLNFVRGDGVYLIDEQGDNYLDMMTNYGVSIFGHAHPLVNRVLHHQLDQIINLHGSFTNDIRAQASKALVTRCGDGYAHVYWGNSGAEAVEAALKFAVLKTGRKKFISASGGYHGKTLGALSATDTKKYRSPFEPLLWEFVSHVYGDSDAFLKLINDTTAAVIIEPIQGESGIIIPPNGYLQTIRKACTKHGAVLILDEIQSGTGRTGEFLASSQAGIVGDIICLGKGLAGGLAVGATVVTADVGSAISRGVHTSTFGGNPLACAGALATINLLDSKLFAHIRDTGQYFVNQLKTLGSSHIKQVRGSGLMIGLELTDNRDEVLKQLQKEKILAIPAGETVVRFLPPYIIEKKHIDVAIKALQKILNS